MKLIKLISVVLGVLLLTACTKYLDHGTVVSKSHVDAFDEWVPVYFTTCSSNICTTNMIPTFVHHDEEWILYLREGDDTGQTNVGPTTFNLFKEGMHYP